jgi:hypothetical protein
MNPGTIASVILFLCTLAPAVGASASRAAACTPLDPDRDRDGYCASVDCDDRHRNIHPGARENCHDKRDNDCDGQIDSADSQCSCPDADRDGHADAVCGGADCNDRDKRVSPEAAEDCSDRKDNDCDGRTDGDDSSCGGPCADSDLDGHTDATCGGTDCNDANPTTYPGSPEICADGEDNDCNGLVDGADTSCACPDIDGDFYQGSTCGGPDCDDLDPSVNPGVFENCFNGTDDNCDGVDDAADPACAFGCPDNDVDGYSDLACGGSDCDDLNQSVYPGALEACSNGIDDDCNGNADSNDVACACTDADLDGFQDVVCGGADCNDFDPSVNPGVFENCFNGADDNCDGVDDAADPACGFGCPDNDFDGFQDLACGGSDCDDLNPNVYPGGFEECSNGIDDDCNGKADASDPSCFCADADGDGSEDRGCGGSDCDDADPAINPFAQEVCDDGVDNDCDGLLDGGDADCAGGSAAFRGAGRSLLGFPRVRRLDRTR